MVQLPRAGAAGFTVLELVVVVAVISIISVSVGMSWPGKVFQLEASTEQVRRDVRLAQGLAMAKNTRYRLYLLSSSTYKITSYTPPAGSETDYRHPGAGGVIVTLPSGISMTSSGLSGGYIEFNGEGRPYVSSSTALTSNATISLSATGETTRTITISPGTGRVS